MRIAYMLTSLGIGGAEKQVISIAERMAARGHQVALLVLRSAQQHECPTKLPVYRLGINKSVASVLSGIVPARRFLRSFKPDLLHSHTFPANMMARMLRATAIAPPIVSTIHNIYEGGWHRTLAYRATDPFTVHTTAISHAVADRYIQIGAVPCKKLSVITNGIDTETFTPAAAPSRHSDFIWLAAGRDVPAKDFDNLLAAFQVVRAVAPDAQLRIAGEPSCRRADMDDTGIQWLGITNDMPRTLAECDAFVLSSAWEGLPLVIGEAMAMEKPVVATDVGGVHELLNDPGGLVPPKNPHALADAMLRVMQMPLSRRSEIGKAGRARIVEHFNIRAKADEWESFYSSILGMR